MLPRIKTISGRVVDAHSITIHANGLDDHVAAVIVDGVEYPIAPLEAWKYVREGVVLCVGPLVVREDDEFKIMIDRDGKLVA